MWPVQRRMSAFCGAQAVATQLRTSQTGLSWHGGNPPVMAGRPPELQRCLGSSENRHVRALSRQDGARNHARRAGCPPERRLRMIGGPAGSAAPRGPFYDPVRRGEDCGVMAS